MKKSHEWIILFVMPYVIAIVIESICFIHLLLHAKESLYLNILHIDELFFDLFPHSIIIFLLLFVWSHEQLEKTLVELGNGWVRNHCTSPATLKKFLHFCRRPCEPNTLSRWQAPLDNRMDIPQSCLL